MLKFGLFVLLLVTGLELAMSRGPVYAQTVTVMAERDVFGMAASYALSALPLSNYNVEVFRNGMLMLPAADYILTGQALTFAPAQVTQEGDIVQVLYYAAATQ